MEQIRGGIETELKLGLPGGGQMEAGKNEKRGTAFPDASEGWPPIGPHWMRNSGTKTCVKVSMDGVPFLRKIDLRNHKGYFDMVRALEGLFGCYGIGDGGRSHDYAIIYEDRDGDWMLVGDVPWQMFAETCRRLRIMKRSEDSFQ